MSNPKATPLHQEGSGFSDTSTVVASPPAFLRRNGYRRKKTNDSVELLPMTPEVEQEDDQFVSPYPPEGMTEGLGITGNVRPITISRIPVGGRGSPHTPVLGNAFEPRTGIIPTTRSIPQTPSSAKPLLSPTSFEHGLRDLDNGFLGGPNPMFGGPAAYSGHSRESSFPETLADPYHIEDDASRLKHLPSSSFDGGPPGIGCPSKHDLHSSRGSWLSVTLLVLSVYSTFMSLLWLVTALVQPRWGRQIYSGGPLSPSTASLLSALLAKTIELSFVTVFVGFLGQTLSRRSVTRYSQGITIAEMSMRTWVIQPGFMLTHWQTIRYAGWTFLGVISFTAAIAAMFYTTASDALISPKLQFGKWQDTSLQGLVRTSYANPTFIKRTCQTPVGIDSDPDNAQDTCLAIENAGESYHNYMSWMTTWAGINQNGTGASIDILERPQGVAMLFDNTTVQGSWITPANMSANFERFGRIIANVTMAMPHANIFAAARDPKNSIMQPNELDGVGGYSIKAAVPSPSLNILCANVGKDELAPLIYVDWSNATTNTSDIPGQKFPYSGWEKDALAVRKDPQWLKTKTAIDEVFLWGTKYARRAPIFPMVPIDYNTVMAPPSEPDDTLYLLAKNSNLVNYTLCAMRSFLYPNCSTQHFVSGTAGGSTLQSHCEDPFDKQAYALSVPDSPITFSSDWVNLAYAWAISLALKDGILNGNASNARLLTQLVPLAPHLPSLYPSIAEALAVLAGNTLLISSTAAAFVHYWQYDSTILTPGNYAPFNASLTTQQYTSSYTQSWQAIFYPVLFVVAIINCWCLVYWFRASGTTVTDFTEPQNAFAIAVQSRPSEGLRGTCGAGPEGEDLGIEWKVGVEGGHYFLKEGERWHRRRRDVEIRGRKGFVFGEMPGGIGSPESRVSSYSKLRDSRGLG